MTEMFKNGGHNLRPVQSLLETRILSKSLEGGIGQILREPGKTDYYTASSYRPISLTQTMCKIMETIVLARLNSYIESNNLPDQEQEGFHKNRSTVYAVVRLVQQIFEGYNKGEVTAADSLI